MGYTSYIQFMNELYLTSTEFKTYVDNWCLLSKRSKATAFENSDIQRKAVALMRKRETA